MNLQEAIEWVEHYDVQDLRIPSNWVDSFWKNDAMYSYELGDLRVWIDCEDHTKSELGYDLPKEEYERFHVVTSDAYNEANDEDNYCSDILMSSNNLKEIIKFVDLHNSYTLSLPK